MSDEFSTEKEESDPFETKKTDPNYADLLGRLGPATRSVQRRNSGRHDKPNSLYMIYIHFDAKGKLVVGQLVKNFPAGGLDQAEQVLLEKAQREEFDNINFLRIVWKRPYYITFVIDNEDWAFHWGPDGDDDPIRFMFRKPGSTAQYETDNYTFFETKKRPHLGAGDAFRVVNYHLDRDGNPVGAGAPIKYSFQIYLETPFKTSSNPHTHIVLIIDPDGQNQGPRT